jgi:DNA repair protein RecN (Recombination protein N)
MAQRAAVSALVAELRELRHELTALDRDERELAHRVDLLTFQVNEIAAAAPRPGEEEALETERTRLANAERLTLLADTAYRALVGAGEPTARGPRGALDSLRDAVAQVEELGRLDPARQGAGEELAEMLYMLEDQARDLRAYREQVEHDPERLAEIDDRVHLLRDLRRKYGATIEDVLAYAETAAAELESLTHREERAATLRTREEALLADIGRRATVLSAARRAAGVRLAASVERAIRQLEMGRARFEVSVTQQPHATGVPLPSAEPAGERMAFDSRGIDRVEFLIAPNAGEPLKPLAKIASGGETARLMLALKSILASVDATPTLVFDEVDVGVGGRSGQVVGEKLWGLTRDGTHQVICITHLPQIAAFAESHFKITKDQQGDHTRTTVANLDEQAQVEELAAMLGGLPVTPEALAAAARMRERIQHWKAERQPATPEPVGLHP